jgi:hypothetical protein
MFIPGFGWTMEIIMNLTGWSTDDRQNRKEVPDHPNRSNGFYEKDGVSFGRVIQAFRFLCPGILFDE